MPDLITDTLKVVTSFFVALVLNKFLSILGKDNFTYPVGTP
ncbi:Uncharacterised protein [Escherichia coli]|nr:Uncharacterised protein [Escherichia coli]